MLDPSAAGRAVKPGPRLLVPHYQYTDPVDQNIGCVSDELVAPVTASELRQGPLDERAVPVQLEHVETCAVFDEAMDGDAGVVVISNVPKAISVKTTSLGLPLSSKNNRDALLRDSFPQNTFPNHLGSRPASAACLARG